MGACCSTLLPEQQAQLKPPLSAASRHGSRASSRHASVHSRRGGAPPLPGDSLAAAALPPAPGGSSRASSTSSSSISGMGTSEEEEAEASELASRTSGGTGGLWGSVDGDSRVKTTYKLRVGVLEGTTFLNEYIVVDTLGRGSFGKVKLCLNTGTDQLCAVKVVSTRLLRRAQKSRMRMGRSGVSRGQASSASSAAALAPGAGGGAGASADPLDDLDDPAAGLRREVEVMKTLDHPNVVKLYEVIEDKEGGKLLMAMEYCEAGALVGPGALTPERHLPEAMAQFYFRQMAAGLAYLHDHHVVHGDVKPENVLLSGSGTVKIGDFGQSQFFGRRDVFNRTLGTPAYLAPEVCAGEAYRGRQADMWALGVSLYLFIFGELPFRGESVLDLYDAVATQEVPYPRAQPISHELQDLFLRLLCKDPRRRCTAEEVMQHPWVTGGAWMALAPGLSLTDGPDAAAAAEAASHEERELQEAMGRSMATLNAEDVAAVVFPEMQEPAGGSPRSPGGSRTQLVDALAAAQGPSSAFTATRLHYLDRDSLLLGVQEDGSEADCAGGSDSEVPTHPPPSAAGESEAEAAEAAAQRRQAQLARLSAVMERSLEGAVLERPAGCASQAQPQGATAAAAATAGAAPAAAEAQAADASAALEPAVRQSSAAVASPWAAAAAAAAAASPSGQGESSAAALAPQSLGRQSGSLPTAPRSLGPDEALRLLPPSPFGSFHEESGGLMARAMQHATQRHAAAMAPTQQQQQQQQQQQAASEGVSRWQRNLQRLSGSGAGSASAGTGGESSEPASAQAVGWAVLDHQGVHTSERPRSGGRGATAMLRSIFTGPADFIEQMADGPAAPLPRAGSAPGPGGSPAGAGAAATEARLRRPSLFAGPSDFMEGVAEAPHRPPRPPPRPAQIKPSASRPIVTNVFLPGDKMGAASSSVHQQTCSYLESGVVEVRYEADVPVTLSSVLSAALPWRRAAARQAAAMAQASAASSPGQAPALARMSAQQPGVGAHTPLSPTPTPGAGGAGLGSSPASSGGLAGLASSSSWRLEAEDKVDSSVHGNTVYDLGVEPGMARRGSELLERSHTLAETVAQATLRAEALLCSAKAGSLDHLLVSERTRGEFLGSLAMLDPRFFQGRWKATAVAKTRVVVAHMTREGLEQFLQANPLAQVHLRASMSRARAEIVKLEALEKIAAAHQAQLQRKARRRRARLPPTPRVQLAAAAAAAAAAAGMAPAVLPEGLPAASAAAAGEQPAVPGKLEPPAAAAATAAEEAAPGAEVSAAAAAAAAAAAPSAGEAPSESEEASTSGSSSEDEGAGRDLLLSAGVSSATLELFSVVMRMREALQQTMSERLAEREQADLAAGKLSPRASGASAAARATSAPLPVPSPGL